MSHFLWVEDFAGSTLKSATEAVFGELLKHQSVPDTEQLKKCFENGEWSMVNGQWYSVNG